MEKETPGDQGQKCGTPHSPDAGGETLSDSGAVSREKRDPTSVWESIIREIKSYFDQGVPNNAKAVLELQKAILDPFSHLMNQVRFVVYFSAFAATLLTTTAILTALWFGYKYSDIPAQLKQVQHDIAQFNQSKSTIDKDMAEVKNNMILLQTGMTAFHTMEGEIQRIAKKAEYAVTQSEATRNHLKSLVQRIEFVRNDHMTKESMNYIGQTLDAYREYLQSNGIYPTLSVIQVEIADEVAGWPHYDPDPTRIRMCPFSVQDPDLICRLYTRHLFPKLAPLECIRSGLAFYFPCSHRNSPRFAELYARIPGAPRDIPLNPRNLDYQLMFSDIKRETHPADAGAVWAAAFWELRGLLGPEIADQLIARTVRAYSPQFPEKFDEKGFVEELMKQVQALKGDQQSQKAREIFVRRGFTF